MIGKRCGRQPPCRLNRVLGYAAALLVHGGERILRFRTAGIGRDLEKLGAAHEVLRKLYALKVEQAEVIGGGGVAELCSSRKQTRCLVAILRTAATGNAKHR